MKLIRLKSQQITHCIWNNSTVRPLIVALIHSQQTHGRRYLYTLCERASVSLTHLEFKTLSPIPEVRWQARISLALPIAGRSVSQRLTC